MSNFNRENIENSFPNAVKGLYLHCNFQNFPGEHASDPPGGVLPLAAALSDPEKILLFHKISLETLNFCCGLNVHMLSCLRITLSLTDALGLSPCSVLFYFDLKVNAFFKSSPSRNNCHIMLLLMSNTVCH